MESNNYNVLHEAKIVNPFFSIVIPTYNRNGLLQETLRSILAQNTNNFEIIIVDDFSVDNTYESVKKDFIEAGISKHITYILLKENQERCIARDTGIALSRGTYIVPFDSDDRMKTNHLEILKRGILKNSFPQIIATNQEYISTEGKLIGETDIKEGRYKKDFFEKGSNLSCHFAIINSKKYLFDSFTGYPKMGEDRIFLLRYTDDIVILPEKSIQMLSHEKNSMNYNLIRYIKIRRNLQKNITGLKGIIDDDIHKKAKKYSGYKLFFDLIIRPLLQK